MPFPVQMLAGSHIKIIKIKTSRGLGDRAGSYDLSKYDKMNFNEVHDESMLVYKSDLERMLKN